MPPPASTGKKQTSRFQKGRSGNPSGRPQGTRNKATLAAEALLDGEAEALTRKAVELALAGDGAALRLCLDRVLPARKDRPVNLALPMISTSASVAAALGAVVEAMGSGDITPAEATAVAGVLEVKRRALEQIEIENRLAALEKKVDLK